jgi:dihydrofolate reductase
MSKTILYIAISLDGFIAGENDDLSWLEPYEGEEYDFEAFIAGVGAMIEGRRTYDVAVEGGFVEVGHPVPSFVLTHHPPTTVPGGIDVTFASGDAKSILAQARAKTEKDIWIVGGAQVARMFVNEDLVDEYVLTIVPVFLGAGIRLFENITNTQSALTLQETKTFDKGLVQLIYRRA